MVQADEEGFEIVDCATDFISDLPDECLACIFYSLGSGDRKRCSLDRIGGLQVKYGDGWVDVKPVPGALVINIGDFLQIVSNGEYRSVDHRVFGELIP
ncbi:hypothetical protein ACFX13_009822 [Malus domestica]